MTARRVATRRVRCPRCGRAPFGYTTATIVETHWDAGDGWRSDVGHHESGDEILHVHACCDCGHRWRLRGVRTVEDLDVGAAA